MNPNEPVYIPSYDRWQKGRRLTIRMFEDKGIPYNVIVEPEEEDDYRSVIDPEYGTVLVLPREYKQKYTTYIETDAPLGSGPARNFGLEHALDNGHDWYWCIDDNIKDFFRHHENQRIHVGDGSVLRLIEEFVKQYENISMAGPHYSMFFPDRNQKPPITFNTRIYSCNLIRTDLGYRWQGRYNEDTDLSLRMLKDGNVTALFNTLLADKQASQDSGGGNTETVYADKSDYDPEGTYEKTKALKRQHPNIVEVTRRSQAIMHDQRWHHDVDYSPFETNEPIRKDDYDPPQFEFTKRRKQ